MFLYHDKEFNNLATGETRGWCGDLRQSASGITGKSEGGKPRPAAAPLNTFAGWKVAYGNHLPANGAFHRLRRVNLYKGNKADVLQVTPLYPSTAVLSLLVQQRLPCSSKITISQLWLCLPRCSGWQTPRTVPCETAR